MMDVSVILTGYRRPEYLMQQIEAIRKQTYKVKDLYVIFNYSDKFKLFNQEEIDCKKIILNNNYGVWFRFLFSINCDTEYICILDDDTIPGSKWIENCVSTIGTHNGIIGCRGLVFPRDDYINYPACYYESFGPTNPSDSVHTVDFCGHAWFYKKEWIKYFINELPPNFPKCGGEDMHLSYSVQKHLGLSTFIPPHPADDRELWGSLFLEDYGNDMMATSRTHSGVNHANQHWVHIINNGFKLIKDL
jgi:glycosyltransferase involved in cell wall biosynthesis